MSNKYSKLRYQGFGILKQSEAQNCPLCYIVSVKMALRYFKFRKNLGRVPSDSISMKVKLKMILYWRTEKQFRLFTNEWVRYCLLTEPSHGEMLVQFMNCSPTVHIVRYHTGRVEELEQIFHWGNYRRLPQLEKS